jgi:predicted O-methyltransferase YrrM
MDDPRWAEVDRYLEESLIGRDPVLEAALADAAAAGLPAIQVAPNQGKLLMLLARAMGARAILEIGTLAGYSTIWLARALPAGGRLITLELDAKHAAVAKKNVERAALADRVEIRIGSALETLPKLAAENAGPFDFVFIDADKPALADYFAWSMKLTRVGSVIIADNVVREGAVVDAASADAAVQGVRRLNRAMAAEPRVSATALQTVGGKGYDGFSLALVIG